jgi:SAM-dependent methyltransferase
LGIDWQSSALGRATILAEAQLLRQALDDVYGQDLLQIGRWGRARELLAGSRVKRQTIVTECACAEADLCCRLAQLPIATAAVDAVLLPHCLEFEPDPYAVLREADRVLGAEGQLLALGFRPASPWGWRAAASRSGFPRGLRRILSERRLRDWLELLGYEITAIQHYLFRLPIEPRVAAVDALLPGALRRGWSYPLPAGAYLLKARKRVLSLTPIRPRRRERRKILDGVMEPTT